MIKKSENGIHKKTLKKTVRIPTLHVSRVWICNTRQYSYQTGYVLRKTKFTTWPGEDEAS